MISKVLYNLLVSIRLATFAAMQSSDPKMVSDCLKEIKSIATKAGKEAQKCFTAPPSS